jgi:hypothetical protein
MTLRHFGMHLTGLFLQKNTIFHGQIDYLQKL